jgi:hypothetical protein
MARCPAHGNRIPSSVRTNGKRAMVNRFAEARGYAIDNRRCSLLVTSAAQSQARASRRLSCRLAASSNSPSSCSRIAPSRSRLSIESSSSTSRWISAGSAAASPAGEGAGVCGLVRAISPPPLPPPRSRSGAAPATSAAPHPASPPPPDHQPGRPQSPAAAPDRPSGQRSPDGIAGLPSRVNPLGVSQWKRQLLDGASELFIRGKQTKDKDEGQAKEAELFQQISSDLLRRLGCRAVRPRDWGEFFAPNLS